MSERQAMSIAKRPLLRKIYYGGLGIMTAFAGWGIAYSCFIDYRETQSPVVVPLIIMGLLLPVIIVGGEMLRIRMGAKKIECVRCKECNSEFPIKAMYKTGRCPECRSKRVIGIRHDGSTI